MNKPIMVKDIMWTEVDIVNGMDTVAQALEQMKHKKTKLLVVDKAHEYDEYGVVLVSDIAKNIMGKSRSLERVNIYEIMNKPMISVHPDMDVRYCANLLAHLNISRCPVMKNREVVGVISLTSIVFNGLRPE